MQLLVVLSLMMPMACLGQLAGGLTDITLDSSDPNVQFAVDAINDYYTQLGDNAQRSLVQVVKAQSQVVAGTLYHLTLKVTSGNQDEICDVQVWSRPWLSGDEKMQVSGDPACKADTMKAPLAGGSSPIDINTPEVQAALSFAVTTMNAQENYLFLRKAVQIDSVTSQVVSGIAYHFKGVHMASTDCAKMGDMKDLDSCNVANGADTRVCDFDVWWQSWMTPEYQLTNMSCQ